MAILDSSQNRLILASGSPRRAEILGEAGVQIDVVPASVDEEELLASGGDLVDAVQLLALAKATSIAESRPGEYVLGADTIVVLDGEELGKPESASHAAEMLSRLSGRSHVVTTGVAIISPSGETRTKFVSTTVMFRTLDDGAIAKYVSSGSPLDKAGGYGIQDRSFAPVASYDVCYLNVVGLPMCATSELLKESGFLKVVGLSCSGHAGFSDAELRSL